MAIATKIDVRELLKAGAHFGHKSSHWNPKMKPYIHSSQGGIYIIDLIQTVEKLEQAAVFLREVAASGKQVLFVGTKRHLQPALKPPPNRPICHTLLNIGLAACLTNFETIYRRVKQLNTLEEQKKSGELAEGHSKREMGEIDEEIAKLNEAFGGIKAMDKLPGALFIADIRTERIAVQEAKRLGIPVVGNCGYQ